MTDAPAAGERRTALVTGASSGFGAAIARALGALGWSLALGARRVDRLQEVAAEVQAAGGKAWAHALDVTDVASLDAFVEATERNLGVPDTLVSNAGTAVPGLLHELSIEDIQGELHTNLLGPMLLVRRLLPAMIERRRGDIVFVSSLNAAQPRPLQAGYSASKAGLETLARVLQMELEGTGIRSTIVRPGPSRTELGWDWPPPMLKRIILSWQHWGVLRHHRYLDAEAIARAVVTAVTAPPGTHLDLIQINPEGPVAD